MSHGGFSMLGQSIAFSIDENGASRDDNHMVNGPFGVIKPLLGLSHGTPEALIETGSAPDPQGRNVEQI